MPVANQLRDSMKRSSWIREMFEEGARLKAIHGEDQVHDFSLGNPILEPPQQVHRQLQEILSNPTPGMHRYMPNAGFERTRACLLYTSPSPRDATLSRMPSSA